MPTTLSTTVRHIYDRVPNPVNSQLIADFHSYMKDNITSIIVGFMKVAVENRMMITQIKKDTDLQVGELSKRIEKLEKKHSSQESEKS